MLEQLPAGMGLKVARPQKTPDPALVRLPVCLLRTCSASADVSASPSTAWRPSASSSRSATCEPNGLHAANTTFTQQHKTRLCKCVFTDNLLTFGLNPHCAVQTHRERGGWVVEIQCTWTQAPSSSPGPP